MGWNERPQTRFSSCGREMFALDAPVRIDWSSATGKHFFVSLSQITNAERNVVNVGVAYCINLDKYRESLIRHGFKVPEFADATACQHDNNCYLVN